MSHYDMMNQWFEAQKKMAEQWQSLLPKQPEDSQKNMSTILEAQQQFFNDYVKSFNPSAGFDGPTHKHFQIQLSILGINCSLLGQKTGKKPIKKVRGRIISLSFLT